MIFRQVVALYNHSLKKLLSTYFVPGSILSAKDIAVNNTQKNNPAFIKPVF